jgi:RHS repeat-associated protein
MAPPAPTHYDPWGTPKQGTPPTFGFAGELQEAGSGLVHLRARWYVPGQGTFASRDPFAGFPTQPYSLHPYQYGYSNPVSFLDPSGKYACNGGSLNAGGFIPYVEFCMEQAIRVDQELNVNTGDSVALKRPLATLIRLFADPALPGGSTKEAQSHSRQFLSPVAERLQFVLWYTRGERLFSHDRVEFTDVDFAREFQDAHYYVNPDGTRYSSALYS